MSEPDSPPNPDAAPQGNLAGFRRHWRADLTSGFLVFLIALPLCLGIALASGYPAIAGVFSAIVGALLTPFISNSELTIKGPAAGLIVIALGAITELSGLYGAERAYALVLGIGVAAGILQILFGLFRTGILGDFFPTSAVHGMLAAIGIIIVAKQLPITLGVKASGPPLELLRQIPDHFAHMNPEIAAIGLISLVILFGMPHLAKRYPTLKRLPAPVLVLAIAIPIGYAFDLSHLHTYTLFSNEYTVSEKYLVAVPSSLFGAITGPDFEALRTGIGWKWVVMFALIGTLESLLSAKAVDMLDPHQRRTNLDRDMLAVGVGNTVSAAIGGLPMISEIVRSKANIDNGAQTRFADLWHGVFLLSFVALLPALIHRIPLAALSAMLVYTGIRLASPREFQHVLEVGREQLLIFITTLVAVLATDLLVGIGIGIVVKVGIHVFNGVSLTAMLRPQFDEAERDGKRVITPQQSAVFGNWLALRRKLESARAAGCSVLLDLEGVSLVDHTTMDHLREQEQEFERAGLQLEVRGLDLLQGLSEHPLAARKRGLATIQRLTLVSPPELEATLRELILSVGATGYTAIAAQGAGRTGVRGEREPQEVIRLEFLLPNSLGRVALERLRREILTDHPVTACIETVQVPRLEDFVPRTQGSPTGVGEAALAGAH